MANLVGIWSIARYLLYRHFKTMSGEDHSLTPYDHFLGMGAPPMVWMVTVPSGPASSGASASHDVGNQPLENEIKTLRDENQALRQENQTLKEEMTNVAAISTALEKEKDRLIMANRYKLFYFAGRGRAEFIRYVLQYTNTPYEEILITHGHDNPMGVVPLLELPDGRQLSQSFAIGRYLAAKTGLLSSDHFENARGDQMVGAIEDIYPVYYRNYVMAKIANDAQMEAAALEELRGKCLKPLFELLEKFLEGEYFFRSKLHWSDFVVAELVDRVESMFDRDLVAAHPKLADHAKRIHQLPRLKEYVAIRRISAIA